MNNTLREFVLSMKETEDELAYLQREAAFLKEKLEQLTTEIIGCKEKLRNQQELVRVTSERHTDRSLVQEILELENVSCLTRFAR
jgi:hypothetical protein